jgi:hypothetical protein
LPFKERSGTKEVGKTLLIGLLLIAKGIVRGDARRTLERHIRNAWAAAATIEKLDLVLVDCDDQGRANKSQMEKIFPVSFAGTAQIPGNLLHHAPV